MRREVALIGKTFGVAVLVIAAIAASAPAQAQTWDVNAFGVGGSFGWVNDVSHDFGSFDPSDVNGWLDYRFEKHSLLRLTFGSMRTAQANSEQVVETPDGPLAVPLIKERVNYLTIGASYLFTEGFFTSGVFGGIGGYHLKPDTVAPPFDAVADQKETVFGWHFGAEGYFRVYKNLGLLARVTYHNVSAHPHRQWVNVNGGIEARF
jgi:hypothetical protein